MHVPHAHADLLQIVGQIFRHPLGQGRYQHTLAEALPDVDLIQQIVDLTSHRANLDLRIYESRGTDDLLDDRALRQFELQLTWCRRHVDRAGCKREELVEHERPIVEGAGQPKAVVDQRELPRAVAVVHAPHLGERDVRLVDHDEKILGEIVEQARGSLAGGATAQMARIVLDAGTGADLEHHLDVEVAFGTPAAGPPAACSPAGARSSRSASSARMSPTARSILGRDVMKCFAG